MKWNDHSKLNGIHAFLSPSKYHWVNYDGDKLERVYLAWQAVQQGVEVHEIAASLIGHRIKLPKIAKSLNMFVNDGIGYKMEPEKVLYFSPHCFGTADAISFRDNMLRIHDLKTGTTKASIKQLEVYAAIFCLEYGIQPTDIEIELRLYQYNEVLVHNPEAEEILYIMAKIKEFDQRIEDILKAEE
jgi:hypothetical protein